MKQVAMIALLVTGAALLAQNPAGAGAVTQWARATHKLPEMNGQQLQITQIEVRYAPGQASPSHSHPCPVLVRVVEGAVRSKVDDNPETTYKEGETFFEPPNGTHAVSRNASDTAPARILATFVCDREGPLSKTAPSK
jgi:quercetin dioxygenase-like cupin family protein